MTTITRILCSAMLVIAVLTTACSAGRSAAAFCETLETETEALNAKYRLRNEALDDQGPVLGMLVTIGGLIEAQGDYVVLMDKLANKAPDEIQSEVELIRDAAQRQADATASGDLGEMIVGGIVTMGQVQGAGQAVDRFIEREC